MVELPQKIKRKNYKFELKKKYQYVGHYRVKERPPIERMKDEFRKLLSPKPKQRAEAGVATASQPGGFNFVVFGAFIFIALIVIGIAWLYLTLQPSSVSIFSPQVEKATINNVIESGSVLTTGTRSAPKYTAAVFVNYETKNLNNYTIAVSTYNSKLPSEVFILNSGRIEANMYPDFITALRSNLAKRKIILNEITLKQLETIPEGAVVIIPSGAIPKEILGFNSRINMNKLADRGVVVIYIGQSFTKMLNGTINGTVVSFTPKTTLTSLPVRFDESGSIQSTDGFGLYQPLYRALPSAGWYGTTKYGSVSILKRGDGAFLFVPQTLDGGWGLRGGYTGAADDISRLIFEIPWTDRSSEIKYYYFTNQTNYSGSQYLFTEQFDSPNITVKVDFIGYSPTSNQPIRETLFTRLAKQRNNILVIEQSGKVVSANITGQPVRMNAQLREAQAAQPTMYLVVVDANGNEVQNFVESANLQSDNSFDVYLYLDRGEYIVKLIDDQNMIYAQTYMKVVSIDIKYRGNDPQKRSVYTFDVTMDGIPKTLSEVSVKVDNGQYGTYKYNNVDRLRVDVSQYTGGEQLPTGKHKFDFTAGGLRETLSVDHNRARTIFDDPLFWVTIFLTCGIVAVGIIFARQENVYFAIDIPDFPPIARTKIALSSDVVLSIFEKINDTYRWQNTPLTATEVKNGFKDIFYQGKPVYITDYNVEYLLEELEKLGKVKESLTYYGLSGWEARAGHSIDYLALMRRLRDICVNNAIPFTNIDESKEVDSVITVVGQQMSLHFYERGRDVPKLLNRVISSIGRGITIILFKNPSDKKHFQDIVDSSPTIGPLIVKMESDNSSLLLHTVDEFEKMLVEFKSM